MGVVSDTCKVEIAEHFQHYKKEGLSDRAAAKKVALELESIFKVPVSSDAVRAKAARAKMDQPDPAQPKSPPKKRKATEKPSHPVEKPKKMNRSEKEKLMSKGMKQVFTDLLKIVEYSKKHDWKETSKEAVQRHLKIIYELTM
jgi:hypothetical protein